MSHAVRSCTMCGSRFRRARRDARSGCSVISRRERVVRRKANWLLAILAVACLLAWGWSYLLPASEAANVWRVGEPASEGTLRFSLLDGHFRLKYGCVCQPPFAATRGWRFCGMQYAVVEFPGPTNGYRVYMIGIPLAVVTPLFAISPLIAVFRGPVRRVWRVRRGCCISCGYDLTGNVSGVCSECGAELAPSRTS